MPRDSGLGTVNMTSRAAAAACTSFSVAGKRRRNREEESLRDMSGHSFRLYVGMFASRARMAPYGTYLVLLVVGHWLLLNTYVGHSVA